ncbi:MAG: thymidine phosphorylase [Eubacteriales bacterium]
MHIIDIIEKKKNNLELTKEEIEYFIQGLTGNGVEKIPEYQVSALLMAIYFNSMTAQETAYLTTAMVNSGDRVDLSAIDGIKVDKHSTGGVADTTTLVLAPLVAACGAPVSKMSGRGLGHTGGTLDKLESIEGFNVVQSIENFKNIVNKTKISVIGQSGNLAPADKILYSLRDVTATVNSIPLIASSIMSKKIAAGCDALVLDVKTGNGAFLTDLKEAEKLAHAMVDLGEAAGIETRAVISDMSQPLGKTVGNALEVREAIDILNGSEGSARLKTVALTLGSLMLELAGIAHRDDAVKMLENAIQDKSGIAKLKEMVTAQGGNADVIDNPNMLPTAKNIIEIKSEQSGYINYMDTKSLGRAASLLGAGREEITDTIDHAVGFIMQCELGDELSSGDTLCVIHCNSDENLQDAIDLIKASIYIENKKADNQQKLIYKII